MVKVKDVFEYLDSEVAPVRLKEGFDNVGLLAGFADEEVKKTMVALDITEEVVLEAAEKNCQLIVSHHPMFFSLNTVVDTDPIQRRVTTLLRNGISAICMHTNLDAAPGGINDLLAKKVGIRSPELIYEGKTDITGEKICIGRMGDIENEMSLGEYMKLVKENLNCNGIRYYDSGRPVKRVAVGGGSCGFLQKYVMEQNCDTFVTGDVKYDDYLMARAVGFNIIEADHFCTENVAMPYLRGKLQEKFPDMVVMISEKHCQTTQFMKSDD